MGEELREGMVGAAGGQWGCEILVMDRPLALGHGSYGAEGGLPRTHRDHTHSALGDKLAGFIPGTPTSSSGRESLGLGRGHLWSPDSLGFAV